jgi:hypothetical protein
VTLVGLTVLCGYGQDAASTQVGNELTAQHLTQCIEAATAGCISASRNGGLESWKLPRLVTTIILNLPTRRATSRYRLAF